MSEGKKYDADKTRLELLPFSALEEVGKVMTFGAKKYGDYNWAAGMAWGRLIGAAFRHLFKYATGEDKDEETGLPHLAHASCCVLFLLEYSLHNRGEDDRFKWPVEITENKVEIKKDCKHSSYLSLSYIKQGLFRCGSCKCIGLQHEHDSSIDWIF